MTQNRSALEKNARDVVRSSSDRAVAGPAPEVIYVSRASSRDEENAITRARLLVDSESPIVAERARLVLQKIALLRELREIKGKVAQPFGRVEPSVFQALMARMNECRTEIQRVQARQTELAHEEKKQNVKESTGRNERVFRFFKGYVREILGAEKVDDLLRRADLEAEESESADAR